MFALLSSASIKPPSSSRAELVAHRCEHGAEHLRRQSAGIRVLPRAVVAVEHRQLADAMHLPVAERCRGGTPAECDDDAVVGDAAKRDDSRETRHVREVLLEKRTAVRD